MGTALIAVAIVLAALGNRTVVPIPALVPAMLTLGLVADAATFYLLVRLYRGDPSFPRLLGLAGCFLYSAILEVAFVIMYPGLLAPHGLLGVPPSTEVWIGTAWHAGMVIGLFACLGLPDWTWQALATVLRLGHRTMASLFWTVAVPSGFAVIVIAAAAIAGHLGPTSIRGVSYAGLGQIVPSGLLVIAALPAAMAVRRLSAASPAERWALAAALVAVATMWLGIMMGSRNSLGWDAHWILGATSATILVLALLYELFMETRTRQLQVDLQRRTITERLGLLDPQAPLEQIARAICVELVGLQEVDCAQMIRLDGIGDVEPTMACEHADSACHAAVAVALPHLRGRDLKARAKAGAFLESLDPGVEGDHRVRGYLENLQRSGVTAMAHAPVGVDQQISWMISVSRTGGSDSQATSELGAVLPVLTDVATVAAILLAPKLRDARVAARSRREVGLILNRRSFRPVFQPVMAVDGNRVVGHEALSRFDSGTSPDRVFASAASVGLDVDLELACIRAAVAEARALPFSESWLSLNVSPAVLVASTDALAQLATEADRPLVLELTEHVVIDDYGPVRDALRKLRPGFRLAVDDVGSGFASLRHILELAPDFVKLDISLVRNIDQDAGRQAMIAGLAAFAGRVGCALIAEGVESAAELAELRDLGVTHAQGYLLGRPAPSGPRAPELRIVQRAPHPRRRPTAEAAAARN